MRFRFGGEGAKLSEIERIEEWRCILLLFRDARPSKRFRTFAKTGIGRGKTRFAQTVSPSDTNAKARSRKMVSIPAQRQPDTAPFLYPVPLLPNRTRPPQSSMTGGKRDNFKKCFGLLCSVLSGGLGIGVDSVDHFPDAQPQIHIGKYFHNASMICKGRFLQHGEVFH